MKATHKMKISITDSPRFSGWQATCKSGKSTVEFDVYGYRDLVIRADYKTKNARIDVFIDIEQKIEVPSKEQLITDITAIVLDKYDCSLPTVLKRGFNWYPHSEQLFYGNKVVSMIVHCADTRKTIAQSRSHMVQIASKLVDYLPKILG